MVTSDLEKLPGKWARAWASSNDSEGLLALFADGCIFEDVTFGVVARGKEELRGFIEGAFAAVPDFIYELRSWFAGGQWAVIEWVMSGWRLRGNPSQIWRARRESNPRPEA